MSNNILKIQNQGNIVTNLRLLYEMKNAGDDLHDAHGYYTKKDVARIAVMSLIATTEGQVDVEELLRHIDDDTMAETDNPILQNVKARLQILRQLGLISTDYSSEIYAITELGEQMLKQIYGTKRSYKLLMELFVNLNTTTEIYDNHCTPDFECYLGFEICYAFSKLDYRISTREMCMIPTYSLCEIDSFVADVQHFRNQNTVFPETHPHYPKTDKGTPQKNISNLTRTINQILRVCDIIKPRTERINGHNYYICTNYGCQYIDALMNKYSRHKLSFLSAHRFRMKNYLERKQTVLQGRTNVYVRAGVDTESSDNGLMFSPYQMIPEVSVNWMLDKAVREQPEERRFQLAVINSQVSLMNLRIKPVYTTEEISPLLIHQTLVEELLAKKNTGETQDKCINEYLEMYKEGVKDTFYPFIHKLLTILGLECHGEVGRMDAMCKYRGHIIPVEIKSYAETPTYNIKGLRQAIENKVCALNTMLENDYDYSTLVIGYDHPVSDTFVRDFIEKAHEKWGIKIVATNLRSLISMCVRKVWKNEQIDLDNLLNSYGIINE
ncbi:MAG: hypothetical protein SPL96_08020 [Bacteroidales bacterium]|nr:hypothetical protein [Bacteroidales bacterium]